MCKEDICPTCKINHDKSHKIINYDERNYICSIHNEKFICYCKPCKKNICMLCENEHNKHEIINYGKIIIKNDVSSSEQIGLNFRFNYLKDVIKYHLIRMHLNIVNVKIVLIYLHFVLAKNVYYIKNLL